MSTVSVIIASVTAIVPSISSSAVKYVVQSGSSSSIKNDFTKSGTFVISTLLPITIPNVVVPTSIATGVPILISYSIGSITITVKGSVTSSVVIVPDKTHSPPSSGCSAV